MSVTIFVSTFNRTETLDRTLRSFRRFTHPYEVVIIDNGSTWDEARLMLDKWSLEDEVCTVMNFLGAKTLPDVVRNISEAVNWYSHRYPKTDWYAVTDADICFEGSAPDTLDAYIEFYEATDDCPGPHTRLHDGIPHHYPLRSRILATDARPVYKKAQRWLTTPEGREIPWSLWAIDTTFHLFPRMDKFLWKKQDTARLGPPYDALHLDWHMNILDPSEEARVYINNRISSWGGSWIAGYWDRFQVDPIDAFHAMLEDASMNQQVDLKNEFFILSWAIQHGYCPEEYATHEKSVQMLEAAIPSLSPYPAYRKDWMRMIYEDDYSCLGWGDA